MVIALQTADAVVFELNNAEPGTFSLAFTAARKTLPTHTLKDLADLKVLVVPKGIEIEKASRCQDAYTISVDVGIQKKIGTDIETEVTALSQLTGEIVDYLTRRPLRNLAGLKWHTTQNTPIYDPETLEQMRVFLSVITVSYKALSTP